MKSQFIVLSISSEAQELLKKEISIRYTDLKFSFQTSSFLSYKIIPGAIDLPELQAYEFTYCYSRALFHSKCSKKQLAEKLRQIAKEFSSKVWCYFRTPQPDIELPIPILPPCAGNDGDIVLEIHSINSSEKEMWVCTREFSTLDNPYYLEDIILPKNSPSRAYLKIAQAFQRFNLKQFGPDQIFLELGAAPGGVAYYLLTHNQKIIGIDTGEMDTILFKQEFSSNPVLANIKLPVQSVRKNDVEKAQQRLGKNHFDWLVCDLNLPLQVSFNESMRISQYSDNLTGFLITLKTPDLSSVMDALRIYEKFKSVHKFKSRLVHIPANKKECLLFALKT